MKVNFIAVSGKMHNDNIKVFTRSGEEYNLLTLCSGCGVWLKVLCRRSMNIPTEKEVVVFGKVVNIYGNIGVLVIDYRNVEEIKVY